MLWWRWDADVFMHLCRSSQVRALLLVDSLVITILNAIVSALDAGNGRPGSVLAASVPVGSYTIVAFCGATLAVLLVGFCWHAYKGAGAEEAAKQVAHTPRDAGSHQPCANAPPPCDSMHSSSVDPGIDASLSSIATVDRAVPAPSELVNAAASATMPGVELASYFRHDSFAGRRNALRIAPTPEQSAVVTALAMSASETPVAVCNACAAMQVLIRPPSVVLLPAGRFGVAAGLLACGALTALASLLSGPLVAHGDVIEAVCNAVAVLCTAATEGDGTLPVPKLDPAALASLSRGIADAILRRGNISRLTLVAACDALSGVCRTSDVAADTAAHAFTASGGVAHLASTLAGFDCVAMPIEAAAVCGALCSIARSKVARAAAIGAGVPRSVASLLSTIASERPQPLLSRVIASACDVVAIVATDERGAEEIFACDGVVPLISAASVYLEMRNNDVDEDWSALVLTVVQAACNAIYVLKSFTWGRNTLVTAGAVQLLRKTLRAFPA